MHKDLIDSDQGMNKFLHFIPFSFNLSAEEWRRCVDCTLSFSTVILELNEKKNTYTHTSIDTHNNPFWIRIIEIILVCFKIFPFLKKQLTYDR